MDYICDADASNMDLQYLNKQSILHYRLKVNVKSQLQPLFFSKDVDSEKENLRDHSSPFLGICSRSYIEIHFCK